jgi:hypothetical protein
MAWEGVRRRRANARELVQASGAAPADRGAPPALREEPLLGYQSGFSSAHSQPERPALITPTGWAVQSGPPTGGVTGPPKGGVTGGVTGPVRIGHPLHLPAGVAEHPAEFAHAIHHTKPGRRRSEYGQHHPGTGPRSGRDRLPAPRQAGQFSEFALRITTGIRSGHGCCLTSDGQQIAMAARPYGRPRAHTKDTLFLTGEVGAHPAYPFVIHTPPAPPRIRSVDGEPPPARRPRHPGTRPSKNPPGSPPGPASRHRPAPSVAAWPARADEPRARAGRSALSCCRTRRRAPRRAPTACVRPIPGGVCGVDR